MVNVINFMPIIRKKITQQKDFMHFHNDETITIDFLLAILTAIS